MPPFTAVLLLIGIALSTVACVVEEPEPALTMPAGVIGIPTGAIDPILCGEAVKRAAPPSGTLTAARLDREANLDRDLAAVATALHCRSADATPGRLAGSFREIASNCNR